MGSELEPCHPAELRDRLRARVAELEAKVEPSPQERDTFAQEP